MDPAIFPNPFEFRPERWLEAKEKDSHLERYLVSFSRGSRQCIGIKYVSLILRCPQDKQKTNLVSE